jgi:hypothetical protein
MADVFLSFTSLLFIVFTKLYGFGKKHTRSISSTSLEIERLLVQQRSIERMS